MQTLLRELICLSVLAGALMHLCPEGGVKRVSQVLCTAVLGLAILSRLDGLDTEKLRFESAGTEASEVRIEQSGALASRELSRRFLESEYSEYITRQAEAIGVTAFQVSLTSELNAEGQWLPCAAEISGDLAPWQREALSQKLVEDLGIPPERQVWNGSGMEK